ncbi:MAG: vitamin K epoxide reductase family protein [Ginsengibacter sp.]
MAESYHTNLVNVASCYVKELKLNVSKTTLKERLNENPFFPSLYSLSNTFERFDIPHQAVKIDKENLENLTTPYIAYVKGQNTGKDFVLVTSVTDQEVQYIAENKKVKKVAKNDFLKNFEHIILQAEPDEKSGEKDFMINRRKEITTANKTSAIIAASVLIFGLTLFFFLHSLPVHFIASASVLLFIKTGGLAATVLLLVYEIDKSNAFVKSICTAGKEANCGAVLQSKASKIFGMSWSEAGFFYFASTFLFVLFPTISFADKTLVLSVANILAAPYILFSVYYQSKVVKQWCPLCLTVQAVLAMELAWSVVNFWQHFALNVLPSAFSLLYIAYSLLIPITVWYILKPLILKAKEESVYKAAYKRLLYNPEIFNHLLQQQPAAADGYQNLGIEIGNPDAENTIIKVCNPYCGPCAKAHPVLDEIIHNNKNVKLKLIFTASNDKDDKRGIAARHLLAINQKRDILKTQQALDDWYLSDKKDYGAFAAKYPINGEIKQQELQIEKMKTWCKEAEISFTPTIFINGRRLPEKYKIEELKYIL